ncbi:hypothetical protein CBS101457_005277 [Exobasidium rhododendri]|nr:hypothetical protein CBS101457_005277 [Exobasidium rhododendri]
MVAADSYHGNPTPWIGAFERVMGDQSDHYHNDTKPTKKSARQSAENSDTFNSIAPNRSSNASPFNAGLLKVGEEELTNDRLRSRSGSVANSSIDDVVLSRPIAPRNRSSHVGFRKQKKEFGSPLVSVSPVDHISIEDMYLNHAPTLQPLHIRNASNGRRVLLRLGSDLGRGLSFLRKKRSGAVNETSKETIFYPTNTARWAKEDGLHPSKLREIRHMIANLDSSDSLILEPGTEEVVYLSFRPSEVEQMRLQAPPQSPSFNVERQQSMSHDDTQLSLTSLETSLSSRSAPETSAASIFDTSHQCKTVDVSGVVSLRASTLLPAEASAVEDGSTPYVTSSSVSSSSSRPPSFYSSNVSSKTSASISAGDDAGNGDVQEMEIPFYVTFCRPQMAVTKHAHGNKLQNKGVITLDFGDVFVGQSLEMEVYLHNQSQIDLFWQARLDDAEYMLQRPPITLSDGEAPIEAINSTDDISYKPNSLAEGSAKGIKISLSPSEPCRDYEQVITFSNMHNAGNSVRVLVKANMLGEARDDALSILSGDVVDFGDCAGGHWTKQLLVLKNNCEQILDVHFSVEKGIEANFQLAELLQRSSDDQVTQDEPPLLHMYDASSSLASTSESGESERDINSGQSVDRSPSSSSSFLMSDLQSHAAAQELARTPTANPQLGLQMSEPPFFALPGQHSTNGKQDLVKQDRRCNGGEDDDDDDDVDASSVASQAGSAPGSPSRGASKQVSKELVMEAPHKKAHSGEATSSEGDRNDKDPKEVYASSRSSSRGLSKDYRAESERRGGDELASTRSDITAISHDGSKLGPFFASSSQASGSNSSQTDLARQVARNGGAAALIGLRGLEQAHGNQIEELILRPGAEYRVIVSYRPPKGHIDKEYSQGKLIEKTFRLLLDYARSKSSGVRSRGGRERKSVQCRIRTCTSFIGVSPKLIDFGAANVGTRKSANFSVTNHSELTARVDLRFVSKVLSMYRDEISIPPLQTLELRVDFFPRRVNENYRKQVTVANLLNRSNDEIFEVRSQNVDEKKISFHSLFYRILTSQGSNYLDFGDVNINCTRLRSFSIENITKNRLAIELSASHSEDLKLFVKAKTSQRKGKEEANRYAELEAADNSPAMVDNDVGRGKVNRSNRATGIDLKERFLESMSQDVPARKENTTWRIAQKNSHYQKSGVKGKSGNKRGDHGEKKDPTKKAPINLMSALKKGGKGKITLKYGRTIAFKDNKLLSEFEYLDLASGPPVDGRRISSKSRKYQTLDVLETGRATGGKGAKNGSELKKKASVAKLAATPSTSRAAKEEASHSVEKKSAPAISALAPASKQKPGLMLSDAVDVSQLSLDELLVAVESQSSSLSTFFLGNPLAEEQSVRTEINLQRQLQDAITTGKLEPVEMLHIEAGEERQVIAIYVPNGSTRPHIQGNARKQDSRIFLRLVEFEVTGVDHVEDFEQILRLDRDELPVRELMVKSNICRSMMELSQPHINFGQMNKGDVKTRKILIQNRSEWALRFCIRKSGNISSGDIKLKNTDRYGVVPGHGKREVEFIFCPSMMGAFQEKLIVENVADRDKDETIYLKANVRKVSNFKVDPGILEFDHQEVLPIGKITKSVVVSNVSAKTRTFVIGVDEEGLHFQTFRVDVLLNSSNDGSVKAMLSKAEEEEVEHISQKLKIANRKGQTEKITKYQDRLVELGVTTQSSSTTSPDFIDGGRGGGEVEGATAILAKAEQQPQDEGVKAGLHKTETSPLPPPSEQEEASKLKQVSSTVTLTLAANQSKKLLVRLRLLPMDPATTWRPNSRFDSGEFSINVRVHEMKNTDEVQTVEIRGRAHGSMLPEEANGDALSQSPGWVVFSALPPPSATDNNNNDNTTPL